jgi:hypothetical protein
VAFSLQTNYTTERPSVLEEFTVNFWGCDELNINFGKINSLLGRNSELSVHNKLTLCKQVIRPVWSYGIQLWGCASDSNIQVIHRYQTKY